jgi:pSer/pThr/pTyr-binding forkhead associated (FHA) protein
VADTDNIQAGGTGEADGVAPDTSSNSIVGDNTADTTIGFSREAAAQLSAVDTDVTTVCRHPDADILLDDVTVSRRHAVFLRHRTAFEVKDLSSLNGTYFDGVRIDTALLSDGAEVQIGK